MNVDELLRGGAWKPIPDCAGRYVMKRGISRVPPEEVAASTVKATEFELPDKEDRVVVLPIPGGGLISYRKIDGSFRHTLNTVEGFGKKLEALGVSL